jgi:ATP sulfurylase
MNLLQDFNTNHPKPALLYCDNQAALHLTKNPMFHERTKHIELDCHFVREKVLAGTIEPLHVNSKFQIADILTKALPPAPFLFLLSKMNTLNLCVHLEGESQDTRKLRGTSR